MNRLNRNEAMKLVQRCLKEEQVSFSRHALEELDADDMTTQDAINVLRGGRIETEAEWERGSWRYRVSTPRYVVVVAFRPELNMVVVTAWRR
ncbi:DUF4258 domain-containing protein [Cystobacter fuscus]|uniref:DUF4258 domain-containing protein n=1 Tax=Cystobacter fuscus TaxID=43 RepID=UPI0012DEFF4E|nr:DUF4258 domain-containing protein [Cystobacter fuscus]